jgi:hypothetical protein
MTSQCDINNHVIYYEYDGFGRLSLVRDQDQNILKKYCYNYAGQPEDCRQIVYYSDPIDADYYKQTPCPSGQTAQPYHVNIAAGAYSSTLNKDDANQKAQQAAQTQANQYGECNDTYVHLMYDNTAGDGFYADLINTNTGETFHFYAGSHSSGWLGDVPPGTYDVYIYNPAYCCDKYYWFGVDCGYFTSGGSASFYSVNIIEGCNYISVSE